MSLTKAERETIVRFSDDDEPMILETFRRSAVAKLQRSGAVLKYHGNRGGQEYWKLEMPKEWFRWPRKKSEARSRLARERQKARMDSRRYKVTGQDTGI